MKIAIDGPAGSGKSTVARALAERCNLTYLDTGAMYRAVTWGCIQQGVASSDAAGATKVARAAKIEFGPMQAGRQQVFLNGEDVTKQIRSAEVDREVSAVSSIPEVREVMVELQRAYGATGNVVAEGRDIGTVVFPDAEVKVFLTADPEARAHRRAVQREGGDAAHDANATANAQEEQQILADLKRRDKLDSTRETSPLKAADDAVRIDSSSLTVEEELEQIERLMAQAGWQGSDAIKFRGNKAAEAESQAEVEGVRKGQAQVPVEATGETATEAPSRPSAVAPADKPQANAAEQGERDNNAQEQTSHGGKASSSQKAANSAAQQASHIKVKKMSASERSADKGQLKAFHRATFDDYFDRSMKEFPLTSKAALATAVYLVGLVTKVAWRWRVEDGDKLWDHEGGRMIVMNHVSMLEPVAAVITEWMHHHRVRCIYKSEFNKSKATMWAFSRAGAIPVQRGTADVEAVRRAVRALKNGEDVLVYPEGTRIKSDDQPVTLHAGFAVMAQMAKADVVPMAVVGARDITPPNSHAKRFHNVYLKVGDPISFKELGVKGRKAQCEAMEKAAMDRVYALRDELRQEHPGKM